MLEEHVQVIDACMLLVDRFIALFAVEMCLILKSISSLNANFFFVLGLFGGQDRLPAILSQHYDGLY